MNGVNVNCEWFLNELEALPPADRAHALSSAHFLELLPDQAKAHALACSACRSALEDFAETRAAFAGPVEAPVHPGPWFVSRVMHAIAAQEQEIEERQNGFWSGVRRLAPRLVAFATLLLMLGGTWAFQEHRSSHQSIQPQMTASEGIFEAMPNVPANDDILVSHEDRLP